MGQRDGRSERGVRRRSVLGATTGLTGVVGTAKLLSGSDRIRVLAAASLAAALEDRIGPAFESSTGVRFDGEYQGTNAILRLVERRSTHPDVVIGADVSLVRDRLVPERTAWDLEFATNDVGIAYNPETDLGARLEDGEPWHEVFTDADEGEIGISDPKQNPLGYRAIHLFELAEREYGLVNFRDAMIERVTVDGQEGQLLGGLEAGNRACAVVYRNMAVDRALPFYELPAAYNFAAPAYEDAYATASYTTDDGHAVTGAIVSYSATVLGTADHPADGRRFVAYLGDHPELLAESGLRVPDSFPRLWGDVPEAIAR